MNICMHFSQYNSQLPVLITKTGRIGYCDTVY